MFKLAEIMIIDYVLYNIIKLKFFSIFVFQVYKSQRLRAGKGKMRNRRRIQKRGPLIVYDSDQVLKNYNSNFK